MAFPATPLHRGTPTCGGKTHKYVFTHAMDEAIRTAYRLFPTMAIEKPSER